MDYHERKSIVSITSTILVLGIYYWSVFANYSELVMSTEEELRFWGKAILIAIPVSIVSKIIVMIIFAVGNYMVTKEKTAYFEDERDKLIELKSTRNAFFIFGMGFLLAMIVLAFGYPFRYMFMAFIGAGVASEIFDNLSRLYFHRKGI